MFGRSCYDCCTQADVSWFEQLLTRRHEYRLANVRADEKQTPNVPDNMKKSIMKVK